MSHQADKSAGSRAESGDLWGSSLTFFPQVSSGLRKMSCQDIFNHNVAKLARMSCQDIFGHNIAKLPEMVCQTIFNHNVAK